MKASDELGRLSELALRQHEVRGWIENYRKLKDQLEKISDMNQAGSWHESCRPGASVSIES